VITQGIWPRNSGLANTRRRGVVQFQPAPNKLPRFDVLEVMVEMRRDEKSRSVDVL